MENDQLTIDGSETHSDAEISDCGKYRYTLTRIWDEALGIAAFICLNPSTADQKKNDATSIRCINFAKFWGFGGLCMVNLFAFRAREPRDMRAAADPVGPENDKWLLKITKESAIVVAGWGTNGVFKGRDQEVKNLLKGKLHYLELTKDKHPGHPLFLKSVLRPIIWE